MIVMVYWITSAVYSLGQYLVLRRAYPPAERVGDKVSSKSVI
jgi:membrane protein insertase Oxa1/YidC/SpoIIIJ